MAWIIMTPILLVLAWLCWHWGSKWIARAAAIRAQTVPGYDPAYDKGDADDYHYGGWITRVVGIAAVISWLAWTCLNIIWLVPAGHVGVVYRFNDIVGQRNSGMQLIAPWEDMKVASTRVQREQFVKLAAFSKETQDVFVDATLNYSVSPDAIQNLYRTVGPDWFEKLVPPRVRQTLKDETVKYSTVAVAPNREAIRRDVRDRLQAQLETYSVNVEDFLLDNIDFLPEFKHAIEEKQIATQQAQTEQNKVQAAEFKKQQAIKTAQGEAQSILIKKRAEATANRLLRRSLNEQVIQFEAIQKLNPEVQTIVVPGGSNLILPGELFAGGGK